MPTLDDFLENYRELLLLSYEPERDWPVIIRGKHKKSGGSIYPRNGEAHRELGNIDKQLRGLNRQILAFFGVDKHCLPKVVVPRKRGRGQGR